jgi:hypothetical protein
LRSATNWQSCIASVLAAVLEHHGVGEAGHRGPVAPSRLPALLALARGQFGHLPRPHEQDGLVPECVEDLPGQAHCG